MRGGLQQNEVMVTMKKPLGFSFKVKDDGVFVTKVKDEGEAKTLGVTRGMKILSINDVKIDKWDQGHRVVYNKTKVEELINTSAGEIPFVFVKPEPGAKLPKGSVKMASAPPAAKAAASDAASAAPAAAPAAAPPAAAPAPGAAAGKMIFDVVVRKNQN